jgi:cell division protein FtsQ
MPKTAPRTPDTAAPAAERQSSRAVRRAERERRRFEKGEVKRFTKRARTRRRVWLAVGAIGVVMVAVLLVAVYSPILALRTIRFDGNSRIATADLQSAVDGQLGTPLALVDFSTITTELSEFSLIRSYVTETVPPDTLVVHIVERQPIGAIRVGGVYTLVDPAGVEIEKSPEAIAGIPIIDVGSKGTDSAAFASVVEVMLALPPALAAQVETIAARTKDDVTLTLVGANQQVVWGSAERSDFKARVLAALLPLYSGSGAGQYIVSAPDSGVFRRG